MRTRNLVCLLAVFAAFAFAADAFAQDKSKEQPKKDEPKKEEPKKEAPAKVLEVPKKEEPKKEVKKEEPKKEEAKKEEPKKDAEAPAPAAGPAAKEQARKVQVSIRKLADKLSDSAKYLPEGKYGVFAVLNFQETGKLAKEKELGILVAAELASYLKKDHRFDLVERERLDKVIGELQLGQTGLLDENTAAKVGKMVQAQALVVGTVSEAGADFLVNARLVGTENGMVLASVKENIPVAGMVALSSEAVVLRTKSDAVYRSFIPGWGQIYNRQITKGVIYSSVFAALIGSGIYFGVSGAMKEQEYKDLEKSFETDSEYAGWTADQKQGKVNNTKKNAEERYLYADISFGVAAGFWVWNLIDAYIWGYDAKSAEAGVLPAAEGRPSLALTPDGGAMLNYGFSF